MSKLQAHLFSREVVPFYLSLLALGAAALLCDAALTCWALSGSAVGWASPGCC